LLVEMLLAVEDVFFGNLPSWEFLDMEIFGVGTDIYADDHI
jgi:hypothetical protein